MRVGVRTRPLQAAGLLELIDRREVIILDRAGTALALAAAALVIYCAG